MVREQKQAWCLLGLFAAAFSISTLLILLVSVKLAPLGFGVFFLGFFVPLVGRKKRDEAEVDMDERDKMIAQKATLGGAMLSMTVFMLACLITFYIYKHQNKESISIQVLPLILHVGAMTFWIARSITVVVLYGRQGNAEPDLGQGTD